ncbi:MAG: Rpn family recombination-promoting nuclease/putative transposase [Clostridiales bacterium]|nr:Rpn family recombination-promoting nuclease/putative transposase [Clostridiales bacterium]
MEADLKNTLILADDETQYDIYARDLLARKCILAHILRSTVDEFQELSPDEVEDCIEDEIYVGVVPTEPGLTNRGQTTAGGDKIVGLNTVQSEKQEGLAVFDILFYVRTRDGVSRIIINVEAQKDEPSGYDILNRAIFYVSRLVSSQKERDFKGKKYDDLKRVYSIWICMNMDECIWNYVHLTNDSILSDHTWKGKLDLLNIVLLGVPDELPKRGRKYRLHRLLSTLFSVDVKPNERIDILENEYHIATGTEFREELDSMCNLSQGILELGETREKERLIVNMDLEGFTLDVISRVTGETVEKIKSVLEKHKMAVLKSVNQKQ